MSINYNTTFDFESQVKKILQRTSIKKSLNETVVSWLLEQKEYKKAVTVCHCADHVGITDVNGVAKIVKADFCRERICNVCAWRRQSKFMAQMFPILEKIGNKYEFIFSTVTIENVSYDDLSQTIDDLMHGYDLLLKRRKVKRAWIGKIRALEITFNPELQTFHPHIHLFIAVKKEYFHNPDLYISQHELCDYWAEAMGIDYTPICHIEKVTDNYSGTLETIKYTFKSSVHDLALKGFFYKLKNRRLISFSGIFAETRRLLKLSDFENILTDDVDIRQGTKILYALYKFDATGGVYTYFDNLELYNKE